MITKTKYLYFIIFTGILIFGNINCNTIETRQGIHPLKSNLEIIEILSENIAKKIVSLAPTTDTICINFTRIEDSWIVEGVLVKTLSNNGKTRIMENKYCDQNFNYEFIFSDLSVKYTSIGKEGFFRKNIVTRKIHLGLYFKVSREKEIIISDNLNEYYTDKVIADEIATIENRNIKSTIGNIPTGSFFSKILSPIIITTTTAVIIYLFFKIRS